jgi:hypothetical protein
VGVNALVYESAKDKFDYDTLRLMPKASCHAYIVAECMEWNGWSGTKEI